jgi:hypothetical protein
VRQRRQRRLEAWSERLAHEPFKRAWRSIALATLVLTVAGGLLVRLTDPEAMTSVGTGLWWALQTVTTVGYGDVVPNSVTGRLTAAVVMLAGLSLLAVTTAAVTNAFVQAAARRRGRGRDDPVLAELIALRAELAQLQTSITTTTPPGHAPPEPGPPGRGGNA